MIYSEQQFFWQDVGVIKQFRIVTGNIQIISDLESLECTLRLPNKTIG